MPGFRQLAREKTLVPECFEISGNSFDISKGIFQNDICKFESYMPSQCQGAEVFYRNAFVLAFVFDRIWKWFQPVIWKFCAGSVSSDAGQKPPLR